MKNNMNLMYIFFLFSNSCVIISIHEMYTNVPTLIEIKIELTNEPLSDIPHPIAIPKGFMKPYKKIYIDDLLTSVLAFLNAIPKLSPSAYTEYKIFFTHL